MLISGITVYSQAIKHQKEILCDGLEKLKIKAFIVQNGFAQKDFLNKNDLIKYDLQIGLTDTTFQIVGFVAVYDCHSRSLMDIQTKTYLGNRIKAGDPFVGNVWIGDHLNFDCINIRKNGKWYLITGTSLEIY